MNSELNAARLSQDNPVERTGAESLFSSPGGGIRDAGGSRFAGDAASPDRPIIWMQAVSSSMAVEVERGSAARAILSEVAVCAEHLVARGEGSSIDLRFLKSTPDERGILLNLLGRGEVSAVVDSIGRSEIQETAIPCVWWVRHFNSDDEIVGELIEVADIPELLVGDRQSVAPSLAALHARQLSGVY